MSAADVDAYLAALDEAPRRTLSALRALVRELLPGADEGLSYQMPAFKVRGKAIVGYAAFKRHLIYAPHSGSVLPRLAAGELAGYVVSAKGGVLQFPFDHALPRALVEKLVALRLAEAFPAG